MASSTQKAGLGWTRIVLLVAGAIALVAITVAIARRTPSPERTAESTGQGAAPQGEVGAVIAQLEARLKDDPGNAEGWRMLGWSYFETGRYADAAGAYRHATALAPEKAEYWSALGESLALAGGGGIGAEARKAFDQALAADPKDPRARYFKGAAKEETGDHKGAIADWQALLADSPANAPWIPNVRGRIEQVARANGITVALAPAPAASPAASAATDAIPGPTAQQLQAASAMTPAEQDAMARDMVARLAARLRADPKNAEGWMRLMRARMVLNDGKGAATAYAEARAAFAGDPTQQAALATAAQQLGLPAAR